MEKENYQCFKISIIIPVYNAMATLQKCIDSVIAQIFSEWEVILVDDGSTDDSVSICKRYAEKDNRIVVLQQEHKGVSEARNLALKSIRGKYICFIDSDDYVEPDYLVKLYAHRDYNLVICGYFVDKYIWGNNNLQGSERHIFPFFIFNNLSHKELMKDLFQSGMAHMTWNKLFHAKIVRENNIRYKKYPINEDYIFVLEYLKYVHSVCVIDIPLYHWKRYEGRLSGVDSIPDNIIDIYNESHLLTREFFGNDTVADQILYYSYNMLVWKYLRFAESNIISKGKAIDFLQVLNKNELFKAAYNAYKPKAFVEKLLFTTEKFGCFQLRYFLHRLLSKLI